MPAEFSGTAQRAAWTLILRYLIITFYVSRHHVRQTRIICLIKSSDEDVESFLATCSDPSCYYVVTSAAYAMIKLIDRYLACRTVNSMVPII